jgi:hypothetical protein
MGVFGTILLIHQNRAIKEAKLVIPENLTVVVFHSPGNLDLILVIFSLRTAPPARQPLVPSKL